MTACLEDLSSVKNGLTMILTERTVLSSLNFICCTSTLTFPATAFLTEVPTVMARSSGRSSNKLSLKSLGSRYLLKSPKGRITLFSPSIQTPALKPDSSRWDWVMVSVIGSGKWDLEVFKPKEGKNRGLVSICLGVLGLKPSLKEPSMFWKIFHFLSTSRNISLCSPNPSLDPKNR